MVVVHHSPGVCDGLFSTSQFVLAHHLAVTERLWKREHLFCKVLDIFWDLTVIGISLAVLVKETKLQLRKQ